MNKLRVAVIGCGSISHFHMEGYLRLADRVEVVAGCDIDGEKLKAWGEKFGITQLYTDYNEMLEKVKPDCVSVTTWNAAHKGATVAALNAGANVICEKPMAMNAAEAQEMLDASKRNRKLLQIGFVRRFGKDAMAFKKLAEDGMIGDVYYAKATYLRKNGCPGGWFGDKRFSGGGPLIDLGVHVIDLSRYLAGNPKPVSAYGVTYNNLGCNRASGGVQGWTIESKDEYEYSVEDMASAMVRFDNGFTLQVEASFNLNIEQDTGFVDIFGTKAGAKLAGPLKLYTSLSGMFADVAMPEGTAFSMDAFNDEIRGFIDAVEGKKECVATAEDGLALMKILDAIYESAKTGRSVDIK